MGIGAISHQCICSVQHAVGDVGMQVQTRHQGHVVADQCTYPRQQFAFCIVRVFGHRGAVQVQVDRVNALRQALLQVRQHIRGNSLKSILGDVRGRTGSGPHRRPQLPAMAFGRINETTHRDIHAGELGLHGLTANVSRKSIAPVECLPIRQTGGERVGLVLKPGDENAGHALPPGTLANSACV